MFASTIFTNLFSLVDDIFKIYVQLTTYSMVLNICILAIFESILNINFIKSRELTNLNVELDSLDKFLLICSLTCMLILFFSLAGLYYSLQRIDKIRKLNEIQSNTFWVEYRNDSILDNILYDTTSKLTNIHFLGQELLHVQFYIDTRMRIHSIYASDILYIQEELEFHFQFKQRKQRDKKLAIRLFKEIKHQPYQEIQHFERTIQILNGEIDMHAMHARHIYATLSAMLNLLNDVSKKIVELKREKALIILKMELLEWM